MSSAVFVALALVNWSQTVVPPPAPAPVPVLEIAIRTIRADGTEMGRASKDGADPFSGYLSVGDSLCSVATNSREADDLIGTGWQISGQIIRHAGDDFTVKVDWKRAWEHGGRVQNGPRGSTEISMRVGDQLPLDTVMPFKSSECGVAMARLEAAMVTRQPWQLRGGGGGGFSGAGRARAGAVQVPAAGGGRAGAVLASGAAVSGSTTANLVPMTTEMWLVDRRPDGTEEALRQVIPTTTSTSAFSFSPITVATARGRVSVALTGTLQLVAAGVLAGTDGSVTSSEPRLRIEMDRQVTVEGGPSSGRHGSSRMNLALPSSTEVISFELPPSRSSERDLLEGHQFSLRLRVSPAK